MKFCKISAKEESFIQTKAEYEAIYNDFEQYAEQLTYETGKATGQSGKAGSYARYLMRLIIFYEELLEVPIKEMVSFTTLRGFEQMEELPAFRAYNTTEKHFPSATLACFRGYVTAKYTVQEEYEDVLLNADLLRSEGVEVQNLIHQPIKKPTKKRNALGESYPRNIVESLAAKKRANYTCKMDSSHFAFINAADRLPFVEAHHLIPMAAQDYFDYKIDFADNIVTLCPNCHRKIHYAMAEEKAEMIECLSAKRAAAYVKYGIEIDQKRLWNFYGIL